MCLIAAHAVPHTLLHDLCADAFHLSPLAISSSMLLRSSSTLVVGLVDDEESVMVLVLEMNKEVTATEALTL
jgi:hypothetical protein